MIFPAADKCQEPEWVLFFDLQFFALHRTETRPSNHSLTVASLFYGPVLLAAEESGPRTDWRPVTLDAGDGGKSVTGDPGTFVSAPATPPSGRSMKTTDAIRCI